MALKDLTSLIFDRLTVVERGSNTDRDGAQWWCRCTCGNRTLVSSTHLLSGHTRSCGCLFEESRKVVHLTHGRAHTAEYAAWFSMCSRCMKPTHPSYSSYGGRGITICQRWQNSFEAFYADMGPRPSPQHSLDRYPDPNGPYAPENTRWATKHEQTRNTRSNRWLTYNGITQCITDWATSLHMSPNALRKRLKNGWPLALALTTPPDPAYSRKKRTESP